MLMQIIAHTPRWVGLLFILLVYLGYSQTRDRSLPRLRVAVLPLVMMGLSLYGISAAFGVAPLTLLAWLAGVAATLMLNHWLRLPRGVRYAPETRRFHIPGSWIPFALVMLTFFARYAVAVMLARDPGLRASTPFMLGVVLSYGLGSGLFLGRALHTWAAARAPQSTMGARAPHPTTEARAPHARTMAPTPQSVGEAGFSA